MDIATVTEIAQLLYGDDWQRPLARGLGPLHPDGVRASIDDRLVRRWAAGERPVPVWVGEALVSLLERRAIALAGRSRLLQGRAERLRADISPKPDPAPDPDLRP